MPPVATPRLGLPLMQPAQAQKHVTHNEALQLIDAAAQLRVLSFGATVPPGTPGAGDVHAVGAGAAGDWTGQDGRLALWDGAGWQFLQPREGWRAWDAGMGALRVMAGGAWQPVVPILQNLAGLGIGTTSDAANRLAVSSPATLLSHAGAGHQVKVNKAGPAETASLLFQSAWTGHAEMGLAGDNDFALKVSAGAAWLDALKVARATGVVSLPQGAATGGPLTVGGAATFSAGATVAGALTLNGAVGGSGVQAGPLDATPGRLLAVGAFGLGATLPAIGNAGVTDGSIVPGLYGYSTAAGGSGGPAGVTRGTLLHLRRDAAGSETQLLVSEAGGNGTGSGFAFARARTGGAWSTWVCGSTQLSTSNANGRVLRLQDGTQTCWHTLATGTAGETAWTFPQAFSSATGLAVTAGAVVASGATLVAPRLTAKSATSVSVSLFDAASARVAASVDLVAVGRWF